MHMCYRVHCTAAMRMVPPIDQSVLGGLKVLCVPQTGHTQHAIIAQYLDFTKCETGGVQAKVVRKPARGVGATIVPSVAATMMPSEEATKDVKHDKDDRQEQWWVSTPSAHTAAASHRE